MLLRRCGILLRVARCRPLSTDATIPNPLPMNANDRTNVANEHARESSRLRNLTETATEFVLSPEMREKLERLSALRFRSSEEIESVEEDIRLAQKVFQVDTTGVEPLYSVVEDVINCPLRDDDVTEDTAARQALRNAPVVSMDFIVVPPVAGPVQTASNATELGSDKDPR